MGDRKMTDKLFLVLLTVLLGSANAVAQPTSGQVGEPAGPQVEVKVETITVEPPTVIQIEVEVDDIIDEVLARLETVGPPTVLGELFDWQGRLGEGQRIEIKGVIGAISAEATDDDLVKVTARGTQIPDRPVDFKVVEHSGGVTICVMYPVDGNDCQAGDKGQLRTPKDKNVSVQFAILVPRNVAFAGRTTNGDVTAIGLRRDVQAYTVNGKVRARDLGGTVEARSVNGSIDVSTTGHARAETVNGSIDVSMGSAKWAGELAFKAVNGSVTLRLPEPIDAEVYLQTLNGSISTELPIARTSQSTKGRRLVEVEGMLGDGGRELRVTTTNGSVRLQRRHAVGDAANSSNDSTSVKIGARVIQRFQEVFEEVFERVQKELGDTSSGS